MVLLQLKASEVFRKYISAIFEQLKGTTLRKLIYFDCYKIEN